MEENATIDSNKPEESSQVQGKRVFQFKPRFFALGLAAITIFLPFLSIRQSEMLVMYFYWPAIWFLQNIVPHTFHPSGGWWMLLWIIVGFLYAYFVWWLVLAGLFKSSHHFKWALVVCSLLAVATFYSFKNYRNHEDWTSRGLNPDRPGYKPAVVLLAGTVDYRFTDWETHWLRTGTAKFEIRMRGYDRYYEMLWTGSSRTYNTFAFTRIALTNFYGTWNRSFAGSGHHGRGGGGEGPYTGLLPGRRMWKGDDFIGANAEQLTAENKGQNETFKKLRQVGPYKVPSEIQFDEGDHHELFIIRKVEFLPEPVAEWFDLVRKKYFERDDKIRQMDLGEPVW